MWRTILLIVVLLVVFLFVGSNMHATRINLPFTKGWEISTAFLLFLSFLVGYGTAYLVGMVRNLKNRRQ